MKRLILIFCLVATALQGAFSQERFGAGIIAGMPTALSAQLRYSSSNALDVLFASDLEEDLFLQCHYDYHITTLKEDKAGIYTINLYAGPGLFLKSSKEEKNIIGVSGNIGFSWLFRNRYDFSLEYAPKISFISPAKLHLTGGFGFRYLF